MLVLTRKAGQEITIGTDGNVRIVVLEVQARRNRVRLGITAPRAVPVHREEIWVQLQAAKESQ